MATTERILVAEDDATARRVMVEMLEEDGFDVQEAADGTEACRMLCHPNNFDLLITDIMMPGATGLAVASKARKQHPATAILFVSGFRNLASSLPPFAGCRFLAKPFRLKELVTAVEELLHPSPIH